jgi:hypothetical protein
VLKIKPTKSGGLYFLFSFKEVLYKTFSGRLGVFGGLFFFELT